MAAFTVIEAIEEFIAANWTHCPIRGFLVEPDAPVPADRSAFAELTFPVAPEEVQISIGSPGSNIFRETGAFLFCVYAPRRMPVQTWAERIDTLRDALRNQRLLDGHLRIFEAPSFPIDNRSDREGYRELSIAVPYEYDLFR